MTAFLLASLCVALFACLAALMHERGVRPVRNLREFFKGQPKVGRVLFGAFFIAMWVFAGTKPDIGAVLHPCTGLQTRVGVEHDVTDGTDAQGEDGCQTGLADGTVEGTLTQERDAADDADEWTDFIPITSTNTTHTLTGDDFRRGFVMTRTGTNEAHDFSAPSNATVCADWEAFGAAEDWIYLSFTNWAFRVGSNEVS